MNDSSKSIEAYWIAEECKNRGYGSGNAEDFVASPSGTDRNVRSPRGRTSRSGSVQQGGRWLNVIYLPNDATNVESAVLFGDGTFEGKEEAVRVLKARRDGIAAAVDFWARRLSHEAPGESGAASLILELKSRVSKESVEGEKYLGSPFLFELGSDKAVSREQLLSAYWYGERAVDSYLEMNLSHRLKRLTYHDPNAVLCYLARNVATWKKRIDSNEASKKLNEIFPPITDAEEGDVSGR